MKKILITLVIMFFTFGAVFAKSSGINFKQLLTTGTPEQVQNALKNGVDMDMKQTLCYAIRYGKTPGVLKVLADNGADIHGTKCFSPIMLMDFTTLGFAMYYQNAITTEELLKLGVSANDLYLPATHNMGVVKAFVKYADAATIDRILSYARANMNATDNYGYTYKTIAQYLQTIDVDLPEFKGKTKVDVAMQLGAPVQKMDVDKNVEIWTYYKHMEDTRYNGTVQGSSYNWGYGVSTINAATTGGFIATNSEKYTIVFQDGVVIKAKKNYERQLH